MENGAFNTDSGFQRLDSNLLFSIIYTEKLKDEINFLCRVQGSAWAVPWYPWFKPFCRNFGFYLDLTFRASQNQKLKILYYTKNAKRRMPAKIVLETFERRRIERNH